MSVSTDINDEELKFKYRAYDEDFNIFYDHITKSSVPHIDNFKYVLWEKDYTCKWFIKTFKAELKHTIVIARYRAYPEGKGRQKIPPGGALTWVKHNMPYICLLHVYADRTAAAKLALQFPEEFKEAREKMQQRNAQRISLTAKETAAKKANYQSPVSHPL